MNSDPSKPALAPRRPAARRRSRRWLPWLGAVLLVGLIVAGLWPRAVPVETTTVQRGPLRATITEEGKTRIRQRYLVSAAVTGQLRRIELKPGAEVTAGETVVAVIDPVKPALLDARTRSLAEARRDTAAANLAKAIKAQEFAASELRRFDRLYEDKTVSVQEYEVVQWREAAAAKDRAAAESALRQVEAELAEFVPAPGADSPPTEILAPANGRVLRVFEESARVVSAGTPLVEVGDPANLEVVVEVLSRDGAAMAPGTPVELHQWGGELPLQAKTRLIEPAAFTKVSALGVEEQRVNLVADITTPAEQRPRLGDGFRVEARIVVWETDSTLKLPVGAVFRRGANWSAFVVEAGRARLRPIQVGRSSGTEVQILDGLREGDEVVLYPGDRVTDGQRTRPLKI